MFKKLFSIFEKKENNLENEVIDEETNDVDIDDIEDVEIQSEVFSEDAVNINDFVEDNKSEVGIYEIEESLSSEDYIESEEVVLDSYETIPEIEPSEINDTIDEIIDTIDTADSFLEDKETDIEIEEYVEEKKENLSFFERLKKGIEKTKKDFSNKLNQIFLGYDKVDEEIFEELEEVLILSDIGFDTSMKISNELRKIADKKRIDNVEDLKKELEILISDILGKNSNDKQDIFPQIIVVVGVNGVGKTTTIGKLASKFKKQGKTVMLAAGDTFRAAAADQLEIWANRAEVPIVRSTEGADPSSVIFDAIKSAKSKGIDILICDTAGRLHNKKNLMDELNKIFRIISREYEEAHKEVYLVIDATTGQNAINQSKTFSEVANVTGIVLTKLDGTAKGGVVIGIADELNVPIRYIGVGEKIEDLQEFSSNEFARALFET